MNRVDVPELPRKIGSAGGINRPSLARVKDVASGSSTATPIACRARLICRVSSLFNAPVSLQFPFARAAISNARLVRDLLPAT